MNPVDGPPWTPADFESSFGDEPPARSPEADLARGRRRVRRRRIAGASAFVAAGVLAVTVVGGQFRPATTVVVPAQTPTASPTPSAATRSTPSPADTAPALRYRTGDGYLDRNGRAFGGFDRGFQATTRNTYDLVKETLDPEGRHLAAYEPDSGSGGSGDYIQVGQKLGWTNAGDNGQGMLLVSVTRPGPGKKPVLTGEAAMGQCSGGFVNLAEPCRKKTIAGAVVRFVSLDVGGFVIDYVQPDGEIASLVKEAAFGNNGAAPLKSFDVSPEQAVELLEDPRLDVIG